MASFRFSNMAAAAILDFKNWKFLAVRKIKRVVLYHRAKFRKNWSNYGQHMAIFRFFKDGGRRHLGFSNFVDFNRWNAEDGQTASPCKILSKSFQPRLRYGDFSIFPRWRPYAILDLWCVCSDHSRRAFAGLYHCAKCHRDPQKALACAETRHMTYRSSKSVHQWGLGAIPRIK